MIIYKATNIHNNKIYIGQTKFTLEDRKRQHLSSMNYQHTKNNLFSRAIAHHGADAFIWEILFETDDPNELDAAEKFAIDAYDSTNPENGYNIKGGGNSIHSHASRTKELIGAAQRGEKNHAFGKSGALSPTSKKVIDLDTGITYVSATECSKQTGISLSKICAVCRGERVTAGGHIFRYVDKPNIEVKRKPRSHRLLNRDTGEVYYSIMDTCKKLTGTKDTYVQFVQMVNKLRKRGIYDFTWREHNLQILDDINS